MEQFKITGSGWQRAVKATVDNEALEVLIFGKATVKNPSHDFNYTVNIVDATGAPKATGDLVIAYDKTTGKVTIEEAGVPTTTIDEGDLFLVSGTFVAEK